ncbi:YWTD domain-containing protein [Aureobasidium namibiae CBS 147.97]|uniref:YWTD domain-containing protein n=1 Tax=Aureobasidium namibiae CBS 147.97 TaxID=1043004 RepID=A0A074W4N7_9PEZI
MSSKKIIALDNGLGKPLGTLSFAGIVTRPEILSIDTKKGSSAQPLTLDLAGTPKGDHPLLLVDGITWSPKTQRIYWTNMGIPTSNDGSIYSSRLDGSDVQAVVPAGGVHTPKQLTIDNEASRLYFSDREGLRVMSCALDGSDIQVLITTGDWRDEAQTTDQTKWCVGITVSHENGLFYWTQKGPSKAGRGRIFCAPIESSGPRTPILLLDRLPEPIDLEVHGDHLYWTDRGELPFGNTLNRANLNSSGTEVLQAENTPAGLKYQVLAQNFDEAIGLSLVPELKKIYVSDLGGSIWSYDMDTSVKELHFQDKDRGFTGIVVI